MREPGSGSRSLTAGPERHRGGEILALSVRSALAAIVCGVVVGSLVGLVDGGRLGMGSTCLAAAGVKPVASQAKPAGDAALLPAESAVPRWKKTGAPRVFTKADLYGYIDGGAELFLEFGFDQLTLQKYANGSNVMAVEIYRMVDPVASTGIYLMKCGKETRDASFKARHTLNRHQLMFVRDRYYVTINNLSGAEGMAPAILEFGAAVASALPADRLPPALGLVPAQDQVPGTLRLVRGPFGLQSIYTLGDGDILQMGGKVAGAAANYKDALGTYTLLVVPYSTPAAARAAFANVQKNLDKYLKPVTTTAARLVFRDYENKFGVVAVAGSKVEVRLHLAKEPK
jgi:hypothetical protein